MKATTSTLPSLLVMGYDYALVHLRYTIPPAIALTYCYRPLCTALDVYKILFLIAIAVVATTPWDSYLIHTRIWTYPPTAIIGPTLFRIPAEEIFFFVIQTYNTSLLYLVLNKPTFHPVYLRGEKFLHDGRRLRLWRRIGSLYMAAMIMGGCMMVLQGKKGLYMGLILVWAVPFALLLWNLAYQFIIQLPITGTLLPIALPTLYLWFVDTLALKRGTWVIEVETKLGWHLWDGLEIEEAAFFLATNVLIVFGLIAFDNALAILHTFPSLFPVVPALPSPFLLVQALLKPAHEYDQERIEGLRQALDRLRAKSRSFYLASSVFEGRLRIDLILLYSFCRVADDLVDNATSHSEAIQWKIQLSRYLDVCYSLPKGDGRNAFIATRFPPDCQAALRLLPTSYLSPAPLYDLLKGFETDLDFSSSINPYPIEDEASLETYASRVAGTVAELCLELVYHHTTIAVSEAKLQAIVHAGGRMGIALQFVNISRDIPVDAKNGRVYLPTSWLKEVGLNPNDILSDPGSAGAENLRQRLLDLAMLIYEEARKAIEQLPIGARGPMRVAVESYMEIGRVLRTPGYNVKAGRATVPMLRRLRVAWKALKR